VVTISITAEAYAAIEKTLPKGAEAWPAQPHGRGGVRLTLERLTALRGPGESYSDVILQLAKTAP
jgi:predicted CopG family antitoxin